VVLYRDCYKCGEQMANLDIKTRALDEDTGQETFEITFEMKCLFCNHSTRIDAEDILYTGDDYYV
jgi:hypothetical protein